MEDVADAGRRARPAPTARSDRAARCALTVLWASVTVVLVDLAVGGSWDAEWHRTHVFDGFFAPPHILIYTVVAVAGGLVMALKLRPGWARYFGPEVPLLGRRHPAALLVLTAGFGGLAAAGPLDATWHTMLGLDETNWSAPHALPAASLTVIACGFLTCRIALAEHIPMSRLTWYLFGYFTAFASAPYLGPCRTTPPGPTPTPRATSGSWP